MLRGAAVAGFALVAGATAFGGSAAAQDVGGLYRVDGRNADGTPYAGTAVITITSANTCRIEWSVGSTSSGICMRNSNAFAAGYVLGEAVGLVIYQILPDGRLDGLWTVADTDGVGKEMLIPMR